MAYTTSNIRGKFFSRIPMITAEMLPRVNAALDVGAQRIVQAAQERVPRGETGLLHDSIRTRWEPEGVYVIAGDQKAFYGHIVEHGSVHAPPHPFLVPAVEETKAEVIALVREALKGLVE